MFTELILISFELGIDRRPFTSILMLSSQLQDEEEVMPKTELRLRKDKLFIL